MTASNCISTKYLTQRLSMMLSIPGKEKNIDNDETPLEAIVQMNAMFHSLVNKVPSVKFVLWSGCPTKKDKLLSELLEDIDIVERYLFDFSRFYSLGNRAYLRINMYDKATTSLGEIKSVISGLKKDEIVPPVSSF